MIINPTSVSGKSRSIRRNFLKQAVFFGVVTCSKMLFGQKDRTQNEDDNMNLGTGKLRELRTFAAVRDAGLSLRDTAVIGVVELKNLHSSYWERVEIHNTYFLGCAFDPKSERLLQQKGAIVLPRFDGLAYDPYRTTLYTPDELMKKMPNGETLDQSIYSEFVAKGKFPPNVIEAVMRGIHDDSIDDALGVLIDRTGPQKIVGIMGGSSNKRNEDFYRLTAQSARLLTKAGYLVMTGGGPGMMEAANLGAYFANCDEALLDRAISILSKALDYQDKDHNPIPAYNEQALAARSLAAENGAQNLGVPTWFYGFEPTNVFATDIAKYFANSRREAGMIQIAVGGVMFAPGSAGTRQEIFMDAAQNHYASTGFQSAMVFLGEEQYKSKTPVFPLLQEVEGGITNFLHITDNPSDVVSFIKSHPPAPPKGA
jgi:predicted Rossmann-fold nucleotide-binding protein